MLTNLGNGNLSAPSMVGGWRTRRKLRYPNGASDSLEARLTYGFLQYRSTRANARIRSAASRMRRNPQRQVDGVSFRTDLPYGFGVSTFGGPRCTTSICRPPDRRQGDALFGAAELPPGRHAGVGLSGVCESDAPTLPVDSVFSPADRLWELPAGRWRRLLVPA